MYDILIKNAKTRKIQNLVNIAIQDGKIVAIAENLEGEAAQPDTKKTFHPFGHGR